MFKKSKRPAFRQRLRHSDSESDDQNANDDNKSTEKILSTSEPDDDGSNLSFHNRQTDKPKSKLSFLQEEEEEDVFIVKKSVYSRRMEKNKQKFLSKSKSNVSDGNEKNGHSVSKQEIRREDNSSQDHEIIVCPEEDEDDEDETNEIRRLSNVKIGSVGSNDGPRFRRAFERGAIPDAKVIFELKKQRQKLARGGGDDFIPVDSHDSQQENTSRLVHESDEDKSEGGSMVDDDDDEDKDRIKFGNVDYRTKEKKKLEERFRVVQEEESAKNKNSDDDDDDDDDESASSVEDDDAQPEESEDETDKWEREQIRKAVRLPNIIYGMNAGTESNRRQRFSNDDVALITKLQVIHDNHNVVPIEIDQEAQESWRTFGSTIPGYISETREVEDVDGFQDRIHAAQQRLESGLQDNKQLLDRVTMELRLADNDIQSYETDVRRLTEDYNFYCQMLEYVSNLCDCINDKLSVLEGIERDVLESYRKYAQWKSERHKNDIQDQNSISLYFIMNHKALALQYSMITEPLSETELLNLYHFDGDQTKRNRCYEMVQRLSTKSNNDNDDSEDETPEYKKLQEELKTIRETRLSTMFEDTDDDFASIPAILKRFQRWKTERSETYRESFIPEFLPKFLTYYLRKDLVLWNIFDDSLSSANDDLFDLEPFRYLVQFSTSPKDLMPIDSDLIPALLDNTVLPKMVAQIDFWNPLSSRQTLRLAKFLSKLIERCPILIDTSQTLPVLLQRIVERIAAVIETDIFIPQMIPEEFFVPITQGHPHRSCYETSVVRFVRRFFENQYWETVRMMENVCRFREVIQDTVLRDLAVEKICSRYLVMSIQRCTGYDPQRTIEMLEGLILMPRSSSSTGRISGKWLAAMNSQALTGLLQQLSDNPVYRDNPKLFCRLISVKKFLEES